MATTSEENKMTDEAGYWCVICGRYLPADDDGVITHDNVAHPDEMDFDDEEKPQ